jgi:hypothetical protein
MTNMNFDSSIERMKELISCGKDDASLKPNISETVENKITAADGKTYGIIREYQKYFIKEQTDNGDFEYIGGIGNKSDNEYPSYHSASRNLELKIQSINEAKNNGLTHEQFKPVEQSEYIIEATENMRNEINRFKQLVSGANDIMNESKTEFITKPTFKDPEGFGIASNPKDQGEPFNKDPEDFKGDIDPSTSSKTPINSGNPFEKEAKANPEKMDIEKTNKKPSEAGKFGEAAKNVPPNSVANQNPKGAKLIKVTEAQMKQVQKMISEGYYDDDVENDSTIYDDDDLLKKFDYPEINKLGKSTKPIPATRTDVDLDLPGDEEEKEEYDDKPENDIDEGFMDNVRAAGAVKQGAQNIAGKIGDKTNAIKQNIQQQGQQVSQQWNKSLAQTSASNVQKIASQLRGILDKMNSQTIRAGGQPLNYRSILSTLSNQIVSGAQPNINKYQTEEVNEDLVNEITEAVLNTFGKHPSYQKPAFTTSAANQPLISGTKDWDDESTKGETPYGTKIGSSAPFDQTVRQRTGNGEIGEDGDNVINGKTQQENSRLGKSGDKAPFVKPVKNIGDNIAKGNPIQNGEIQQSKTKLGQKGETKPFDKNVTSESKKEELLNKLAESIVIGLKKK